MFCTQCDQEYDQIKNIPRLLILCGHSICQTCCYQLFNYNKIQCPQCNTLTFIDAISLLPKNLALINFTSNLQLCPKHHKKYEAYCQSENTLICIECILQDGHRNHEMDSIKNCFEKYKDRWSKKLQKITILTEKQDLLLKQGTQLREDYHNNFHNMKQIISTFFSTVRDLITREEDSLLNKIKDTYNHNDSKYLQKMNILEDQISNTSAIMDRLQNYQTFNQIQFLQTFHDREEMYSQINQQFQDMPKVAPVVFNKKSCIEALSKLIQGLGTETKHQKKVSSVNINGYSSASSYKKQNQPITTIKAVRKAPVTGNSSNSIQTKKKLSSKKQLSLLVSQTPIQHSPNLPTKRSQTKKQASEQRQAVQLNCNPLANQIKGDISAVDSRESLCHSFMSNMTSFFSERRNIYLIGGFNEQANNIVKYNMFANTWEKVCDLATNRSKFGSIGVGKELFLFGGKKGKERVNDAQIYNTTNGKWCKFSPMNKNRSGFAVIAVEDQLYFIGGNDGDSILNTVQTLNVNTGEWKRRESMHEVRDELAVAVGKNNKIYAIGGFGGKNNQPLRSVQMFDPKTQKWKMMPEMNSPRRALAASVLADGVYAIGGFDGNIYMKSVQKYEQGNAGWVYITEMKQARCTHSAVSIFETQQIFVFGGFDYVPLDSVQRYNIITNEWEVICTMPVPRFMHASILIKQE